MNLAQDGAQDGPAWPQDGAKTAPRWAKMAKVGARWGEDGANMGRHGANMVPRWGQDGAKRAPKWAKMGPDGAKIRHLEPPRKTLNDRSPNSPRCISPE